MESERQPSKFLDDATTNLKNLIDDSNDAILSKEIEPSKKYAWTQTIDTLYIYVPVRPRIVHKGVNVLATTGKDGNSHWLTVIVDTVPRVHAQLSNKVICKSLDWDITYQKEASPFYLRQVLPGATTPLEVCIVLAKEIPQKWDFLFF